MFMNARSSLLVVSLVATALTGCTQEGSDSDQAGGAMMMEEQAPMSMPDFLASGFVKTANLDELIDSRYGIYVLDNPGVMTTVDNYTARDLKAAAPEGAALALKQALDGGIRIPTSDQLTVDATPRFDCELDAYQTGNGVPLLLPPGRENAAYLTNLMGKPTKPISSVLEYTAAVEGTAIDTGALRLAQEAEGEIMFSVVIPSKHMTLYFGGHAVRDAWTLLAVNLSTPCSS